MSFEGSPSPSLSSGSDDFAALLDAELLGERLSTPETLADEDLELQEPENDGNSIGADEAVDVEGGSQEEEEEDAIDITEDGEDEILVETGGSQVQEIRWDDVRKRKRGDDAESPGSPDVGADGKCPPHPGFMWGVCIRCGGQKSTTPTNDPIKTDVALRYIHEGLEVSEVEASRMRRDELKRVTGKQKLLLVVDLDHTMLNSARFVEVSPDEEAYLAAAYLGPVPASSSAATVGEQQGNSRSLHQLTRLQMWTKLRPFAHEFLEEASKMYEMYVYTMGERMYALAMAQLLDPTGRLFGDRIISQLDSTKRNTKDLDVVLGAESAVVILDDTEGVWPKHRSNLLLMERYHFFTSSSRQFGVKAPSLAQVHRDESETEGTLATTLKTLRAIHHGFFHGHSTQNVKRRPSSDSTDVREVIRAVRAKVLANCNIVFSRIFPTGLPTPELHPFWQLTVELGARCSTSCDSATTHVVALDRGTDKARWAKQRGVFLVHPSWVEAAQYLWCRPSERAYPVTDDTSGYPVSTFAKSIPVELRSTETTASDNGEVGPSPHDNKRQKHENECAPEKVNGLNNTTLECAAGVDGSPLLHVNGSTDAGSEQKGKGIG